MKFRILLNLGIFFTFFLLVFIIEFYMKYNGYNNLTLVKYDCKKYQEVHRCSNYNNEIKEDKNFYNNNIEFKEYKYKESNIDTKIEKIVNAKEVQREFNILQNDLKYIYELNSSNAVSGLARANNFYPSKYKRVGSKIKILAVSDSFGEGMGLYNPYSDTWIGQLENTLLSDGYNVEVDRFASSGANFFDFYEMLSSKNIEAIDPDIIVLSLLANDLTLPHYKADYYYVKCIKDGVGGEFFNSLFREYIPYIYSKILSSNCDMQRLKAKYGDEAIYDGYLKLEDAPFGDLYKESMNKIIENANGRPIVIQPLFSNFDNEIVTFCCASPYYYINDYINYLESIGYIIPNIDINKITKIGDLNFDLIATLPPVDWAHWSPFWIDKIVTPTIESVKTIIDNKLLNDSKIDLLSTNSLIRTSPRSVRVNDLNYIQFEMSKDPKKLYITDNERDRMVVKLGDILDEVFCAGINRPHIRIYLNQLKHKEDKIIFNLLSSESQLVIAGIYYDKNKIERFTKLEVLKPNESKMYFPNEKIVGLIVGAPISGCNSEERWSVPSFLAQIKFQ